MKREHTQRVYFEQLKRAVAIEAVLARYGIELKQQGATLKGCCPIHKGSNAKQFVVSNGLWHCFGDCNRGGSVIEFVAAKENVEIREAALMIARWFAIGSGPVISQHSERRRKAMAAGTKPSHRLHAVEDREGKDPFWHPVGSAWPDKDGGFQLRIPPGVSVSGRIAMRPYTEKDAEEEEQRSKRKK